jgi:hypothetical protein
MSRSNLRGPARVLAPSLLLALAMSVAAVPVAEAGRRGGGAAVTRHSSPPGGARTPHESYRMNAATRTWARARGQLTDVRAAALVAGGKLSQREAFLLVRGGVEARRVARAIELEPGEVGIAFSARADKLQRLGLSRREARILARCGARPARVRELLESLVYRFLAGTDPAWAVPADPPAGAGVPDPRLDEAERAARVRVALDYFGVAPGLDEEAQLEAAHRAYRAIARSTHPDRIEARTDLTPAAKDIAIERFKTAARHHDAILAARRPRRP